MKTNCDKQLPVFAEHPWKLFSLVHPQTVPEWHSVLIFIFCKVLNIKRDTLYL